MAHPGNFMHTSAEHTNGSQADDGEAPLEVALVNLMPDSAFLETEQQFLRLFAAADVRLYTPEDRQNSPAVGEHVRHRYGSIDELLATRPAGVVITGCEPCADELRAEPSWDQLITLFEWAVQATETAWVSCLAAHAALLHFDGLERRRLSAKCSGVFPQDLDQGHFLTAGLPGPVAVPHSRLNGVPTAAMIAAGWEVPMSSPTGWTLATAERHGCLMVLVQGHPEYDGAALLREYRRDVRRWQRSERPDYPPVPSPYLDRAARDGFSRFRAESERSGPDPARMELFPFEEVVRRLETPWAPVAVRLGGRWLAELRRRVSARAGVTAPLA
jgi:homoserine O-succinyltransferase